LKQDSIPLSYTPRKFISHPTDNVFYMIESDHRTHGPAATQRIIAEKVSLAPQAAEGTTDCIGSFWCKG
jgi:splicing factor 3B subunit 3